MIKKINISPSYDELVTEYKKKNIKKTGKILHFEGIADKDIYNPAIIHDHGKTYIAARVESRFSNWMDPEKYDPTVIFFQKNHHGAWSPIENAPIFNQAEDPFATWIHDEDGYRILIFGVVKILERRPGELPTIGTLFYKGKDIFSLEKEPFAIIPDMKDIRVVQRAKQNEIIVCTRPLVAGWQTGRIGMTKIKKITELTKENIWKAYIDYNQVQHGTWLGANKLYLLQNNRTKEEEIGVLGHVATADENGALHYAAMTFTVDPDNLRDQDAPSAIPKIIAIREEFEDGPAKNDYLKDVVFPASLEHGHNGIIKLYAGLSDCRIGTILIKNPFATDEQML